MVPTNFAYTLVLFGNFIGIFAIECNETKKNEGQI